MILVFDTNVFLQDHEDIWPLLAYFPRPSQPPRFMVAVDDGAMHIEAEYANYAAASDPDSPIRKIAKRIMDGFALFVVRSPVAPSSELTYRLAAAKCTTAVEEALFGVAESHRNAALASGDAEPLDAAKRARTECILVCPNDPLALPISRAYLETGKIHQIECDATGPITASLNEVLKFIWAPHEHCPSSLYELRLLLGEYRCGLRTSEEREFLEFKNPNVPYLCERLLREAVAAVCGMLNSRDGRVIIGVDNETGSICPFPPRYNSPNKPISVDQLLIDVYAEIDRISPMPGCLVQAWTILDDSKENCVLVIQVQQGNREYVYRNRHGRLNATKWLRRGTATVPDRTWRRATT